MKSRKGYIKALSPLSRHAEYILTQYFSSGKTVKIPRPNRALKSRATDISSEIRAPSQSPVTDILRGFFDPVSENTAEIKPLYSFSFFMLSVIIFILKFPVFSKSVKSVIQFCIAFRRITAPLFQNYRRQKDHLPLPH